MNVLAIKNDPGRSFQELADIRFLIQLEGVDGDEIRGSVHGAGIWSCKVPALCTKCSALRLAGLPRQEYGHII